MIDESTAPADPPGKKPSSLSRLAERLRPYLGKAWDHDEAERLKRLLSEARATRSPFHLTREELDQVFRWKLGPQEGRQRDLRARITGELAQTVTQTVFGIRDTSIDAVRVQVGLLCALPGVGVPVASAILALAQPERFGVIDRLNWRVLYGEERDSFSIPNYLDYLQVLSELAASLGASVQAVDEAIWAMALEYTTS